MTHPMNATKSYRPYLTHEEINLMLALLSEADTKDPLISGLHKKLKTIQIKIEADLLSPAYTASPQETLLSKLGGSSSPLSFSPLEKRKAAYEKLAEEGAEKLTEEEKELAETYKWENGLETD